MIPELKLGMKATCLKGLARDHRSLWGQNKHPAFTGVLVPTHTDTHQGITFDCPWISPCFTGWVFPLAVFFFLTVEKWRGKYRDVCPLPPYIVPSDYRHPRPGCCSHHSGWMTSFSPQVQSSHWGSCLVLYSPWVWTNESWHEATITVSDTEVSEPAILCTHLLAWNFAFHTTGTDKTWN